jgi:hypothetical protein
MSGADLVQSSAHRVEGEFGPVAIAAQMSQVKVLKPSGDDLFGEVGGGFIAEMAMAAEDPLLDAPGAAPVVLEQFQIMVGLEQQHMGGADPLNRQFGGAAQISQQADIDQRRSDEQTDWILRIVRHGKGVHSDVADFKGCACCEKPAVAGGSELVFEGFPCRSVTVDRDAELGAERYQSLRMIGVLVSDEDGMERFRCAPDLGEALADLASAEPRIDQNTNLFGFEVSAVARGAAAQNSQSHSHTRELTTTQLERAMLLQPLNNGPGNSVRLPS